MHVTKVRIENYKSILDSGEIELRPGFNFVVGQNDAGKSAFLEAISLPEQSKPHRSSVNIPFATGSPKPYSQTHLSISLNVKDFNDHLNAYASYTIVVDGAIANNNPAELLKAAFASPLIFETSWINRGSARKELQIGANTGTQYNIAVRNIHYPSGLMFGEEPAEGPTGALVDVLAEAVTRSIYAFKAERFATRPHQPTGQTSLATDSSNLADVLTHLAAANPPRFKRLTAHLTEIFPHITAVTAKIQNSIATVHIWSEPPHLEREDLAVPLADSGTGISHVLAILYVIITSSVSKIVVIDEPQSFLHPGAARKLFALLRQYPQHQYIISTHAPPSLTEGDAVFIARREGPETKITPMDFQSQAATAEFLVEVGARLSDVFGADSVLWVEGKTEELCFPIILRELTGRRLAGTQLLALIHTGDLNKRDAARIFAIYSSLSRGPTLMPQALAFVLDDEGRSAQEKKELDKLSNGLVRWLPRRMFENYLIDPAAIASVINEEHGQLTITAEAVSAWIEQHAGDSRFWKDGRPAESYPSQPWFDFVHGAEVLRLAFVEFAPHGTDYDKVRHGQALTKFLCAVRSDDMRGLADFIAPLLA